MPSAADESYDVLRRAVIEALGPRPSPERRRQIAGDLRALAEQQERMAARDEQVPDEERAARPGASRVAGMYVRLNLEPDPRTGAPRLRLTLGKQSWIDLGAPERVDVQRVGEEVWVVATKGKAGYALESAGFLQSCILGLDSPVGRLKPGRYATSMRAGALVIGEKVA